MGVLKYPHLFEPLQVRGVVFKNRLFASPEGFYNIQNDGFPNADCAAFFGRKAQGGLASVCVGDCIVDRDTGMHYPFLFRIDDPNSQPGFSTLAAAINHHGAIASAELSHAGMYSMTPAMEGKPVYGPVAIENGMYGPVLEMPEEEMIRIAGKYADAARFAKQVGFGMVTIHAGHGWMMGQFFSSKLNTRTDKYGGPLLENRARFPLMILDEIRKAVGPAFPIEVRISGTEITDKGYDLAEGIEIAKIIDDHCDIIHVSTGHHNIIEASMVTHPSMFLPDGCNVEYAAEIKKHVKSYVATVGALTDPAMMEEIIASGKADIVEIGRQSLADPDIAKKARAGKDEEINKCMRCSACFGCAGRYRHFHCAINPEIGHELEYAAKPAVKEIKNVMVAGGGVGGMEAALTAANRGHKVTLVEKTGKLGGTLRCEFEVSFKKHLDEYLDRQARRCNEHPNITVMMNTEATPELAEKLAPDTIIAATGARPMIPTFLKGYDLPNVMGAEDCYYNKEKAGQKMVILGGGLVGLELALHMQENGHEVIVVEMRPELGVDQFSMHTPALMIQLGKQNIDIRTSTKALEITEKGISVEGPDGEYFIDADTIVYAIGQKPQTEAAIALHDCAPEFFILGDCIMPQNIMNATQAAHGVAYDIGI